ncbi:MAG: ABC transporter ATP-binding protein [Euzebya sp.]
MTAALTHTADVVALTDDVTRVPLDITELSVSLGGAVILDRVSLSVPAGRTLALLGPSGCGKTTLLRAVAGLQDSTGGTVRLDGEDVTAVDAERRGVGMVFQDGALFPHMDVAANVGFGLSRRARRGDAVPGALALVGLDGFGGRMPATLSGGQQQRVALARALVTRPRVLLLDEPFSSLDANLRTQVRADVAALLRELAITAVVVTHDQEEAFLLGHEVAVMIQGRIHQQAAPEVIYESPASLEVAEFLGDANMIQATAQGDRAQTWFGTVPLQQPATGVVRVLIRPEHLAMSPGSDATVTAVEYYGHDAVSLLDGPHGAVRVRTMSAPPFGQGDRVGVSYVGPPAQGYS